MKLEFFEGVVESRADPLKLGRCKVRVVGVHTENTTLLPTKDLPWAIPLQPIISAAVSGIGISPTGVVEGTWVTGYFRDGDSKQQFVMVGTIAGVPEEKEVTFNDENKITLGSNDPTSGGTGSGGSGSGQGGSGGNTGSGSTSSGQGSTQSGQTGEQVLNQEDSTGQSGPNSGGSGGPAGWKLGDTSKPFESGNKGAAAVSTGKGDPGGVSYGSHQLASGRDQTGAALNSRANNSPVQQFVNQKYPNEFKGLVPGSTAFTNKWKEMAAKDPSGFENAQYDYFKSEYYNKGVNSVRSKGLDLANRGPAVQDMIWSTSVQYGPGKAGTIFARTLAGKDVSKMSDEDIIKAVQANKAKNVNTDFSSSPQSTRNSVAARAKREEAALLALNSKSGDTSAPNKTEDEKKGPEQEPDGTSAQSPTGSEEDIEYVPPDGSGSSSGVKIPVTPDANTKPGFQDPAGNYPRDKWLKEQDVSRIARNQKIRETIIQAKKDSLVKGVQSAGGVSWNEPESKYDAIYPLNHVRQTESGHVMEFDDTPNKERIHIYHRMGAFIEWHPDGTVVYKSTKDEYEITVKDRDVWVGGNCNITVVGNTNVYTQGVMRVESDGDMFIKTKSNMRIGAEGTLHMESNGPMYVGSQSNLNEAGANILMNCSWTAANVNAGGYDAGEIAVQVMHDSAVPVPKEEEEAVIQEARNEGSVPSDSDSSSSSNGSGGTGGSSSGGNGTETSEQGDPESKEDEEKKNEPPVGCDFQPDDVKPSLQISPNFKLADLTTSAYFGHSIKEQGGMSKAEIAKNLCMLANQILEPIAAKYGRSSFIITSGFRAGTGTSQHLKGQAVDIQFPGVTGDANVVARAKELAAMLPYDQMILEYHGKSPVYHISIGNGRKQKLTTPNLRNYFTGFRDRQMKEI